MGQPKRFDPEEKLDLAVEAFWQNGFEGSAMQDLCKAMGLFPGSLYGTYGGKDRLFAKAIERYLETVSAEAVKTLEGRTPGLEALRAYFGGIIDGIVDGKRHWGCLITNTIVELAQRDPLIRSKIDAHLERLEAAFAAAITRAQAAGEIANGIPPDSAIFLVCVVQGLNVLAKTKPPRERLEGIASAALAGLGAGRH